MSGSKEPKERYEIESTPQWLLKAVFHGLFPRNNIGHKQTKKYAQGQNEKVRTNDIIVKMLFKKCKAIMYKERNVLNSYVLV